MSVESMMVTINGVPPSMNAFAGRNNVWEYRATKKKWTWAVKTACLASEGRPPQPWEKARVEITYFFPDRRRRDPDNYAGKFVLDGLTRAGVIVDDDLKHISVTIRGGYDKGTARTQILIINEENNT